MYKIAICDDNEEYLSEFKEVICKTPEYNPDIMEVYTFQSGEEFLKESIAEIQLAFCSGVVSPLPEHFNVQPYRYFMKQSDLEQTKKVIGELLVEMIRRHDSEIEVVSDGRAMRISNDQIMYIERRKQGRELFIQENLMDGTSDNRRTGSAGKVRGNPGFIKGNGNGNRVHPGK